MSLSRVTSTARWAWVDYSSAVPGLSKRAGGLARRRRGPRAKAPRRKEELLKERGRSTSIEGDCFFCSHFLPISSPLRLRVFARHPVVLCCSCHLTGASRQGAKTQRRTIEGEGTIEVDRSGLFLLLILPASFFPFASWRLCAPPCCPLLLVSFDRASRQGAKTQRRTIEGEGTIEVDRSGLFLLLILPANFFPFASSRLCAPPCCPLLIVAFDRGLAPRR